jgi:hypothetical protein
MFGRGEMTLVVSQATAELYDIGRTADLLPTRLHWQWPTPYHSRSSLWKLSLALMLVDGRTRMSSILAQDGSRTVHAFDLLADRRELWSKFGILGPTSRSQLPKLLWHHIRSRWSSTSWSISCESSCMTTD